MSNITDVLPARWRPVAKSIVAALATFVGAVLLQIEPGEVIADITQREWVEVVAVMLGVGGAAYGTRNEPLPEPPAAPPPDAT